MLSHRLAFCNLFPKLKLRHLASVVAGLILSASLTLAAETEDPMRPAIIPSPQTTRVTEPLDAEGYVDFIGALNAKLGGGVVPSDNAVIPLMQAMGPCDGNGLIPNLILKELGQREWQPGDVDFQSHRDVHRSKMEADPEISRSFLDRYSKAMSAPWMEAQFPEVAGLLSINERALAAISAAVQRPKYYRPLVRVRPSDDMVSILLPDVQESREVSRQFQARAMLHLGHGRLEEARLDLLTMHRQARHISRGATIIEGLVGVAIDAMATEKDIVWALHPEQTPDSIAAYRAELAELPWIGDFTSKLDLAERYMGLDLIQGLARGRGTSAWSNIGINPSPDGDELVFGMHSAEFAQALTALTLDWNVTLSTINPIYDDLVAVAKHPNRAQRLAAIAQFDGRLAAYRREASSFSGIVSNVLGGNKVRGKSMAQTLASLLVPAVRQAREAEDRVQTRQQVRNVFLAAVEYRLRNGDYPESLETLVPEFIDEIPIDVYTERPLRYVTEGTTLKIYSFGPNGIDNRGMTFGTGEGHDDLVYSDPPPME